MLRPAGKRLGGNGLFEGCRQKCVRSGKLPIDAKQVKHAKTTGVEEGEPLLDGGNGIEI